jgi:hypothetical protein
MSTFYLLPPRALLADRLADSLHRLLPGLDWSASARRRLVDWLTDGVVAQPDVFLVPREDLPTGEPVEQSLIAGFGAEVGDEVIEVRSPSTTGALVTRRWRVGSTRVDAA